ncbi:MAG: hypothetical protein KDD67_07340 [Ignavibacteriae bacterium]|nr:hypothetical protein [Ignavibacteriota bacterium]MCB9217286.1 hypothetical protein [Ignavibacteria bacterium]
MSTKSLLTTLAVVFVLLLSGTMLIAQTPNPDICKPDCQGSEFSATQTIILTFPNGCVVRVKYAYRTACGTWKDLGIISVEELTPQCSGLSTSTLLDIVTEELFKQNPMGFPVPTGVGGDTCYTHWRVVKGGCWTDTVDCDGDTVHIPCGDACCLGSYLICAHDSVVISVNPTGFYVEGECDTLDPYCEPVCGQSESSMKSGDPDIGALNPLHFHRSQFESAVVSEKVLLEKEATTPVNSDPKQLPQTESVRESETVTTRVRSRE